MTAREFTGDKVADKAKIGAALVGGYLLGRTKKAKTAMRLVLWLNGSTAGGIARDSVKRVAQSPELMKLTTQLREPLLDAARKAAAAAVEARVAGLADSLQERTAKLTASLEDVQGEVAERAGQAGEAGQQAQEQVQKIGQQLPGRPKQDEGEKPEQAQQQQGEQEADQQQDGEQPKSGKKQSGQGEKQSVAG